MPLRLNYFFLCDRLFFPCPPPAPRDATTLGRMGFDIRIEVATGFEDLPIRSNYKEFNTVSKVLEGRKLWGLAPI